MALTDPTNQDTARLVELITNSFYGDGFDLVARPKAEAGKWTEMPEVGAVAGFVIRTLLTDRCGSF